MILTYPIGNAYPTANGGFGTSLGIRMSSASAAHGAPGVEELVAENGYPASRGQSTPATPASGMSIGGQPNLLIAGVVFVALLVLLVFTARRIGDEKEFTNIKGSAYNVLVIGLAAVISIPIFKYLFTRFNVPGLSAWVSAV